ncbi:MAG: acyl-CoA dehydrogenase family protein [Actinomycetota bacterium]|nr:acyl-CoA dehydrogenase family protein [Actinomycetota bacterium]
MERIVLEPDHELFRETAREFVQRSVLPGYERWREQRSIDRETWREAGKQGLLGLGVEEQYGGSAAGDYRFSAVLSEELAKVSFGIHSSFAIHYDIVAPYLTELTTEEQKQRWLPRFCAGDLVTAIGMTEPSAGSDLAALRTTAVRDGDGWVLNGSKTFITNGYLADLVLVAAKTTPDRGAKGISLFAVEAGMPGFERGRKLDKVGQPEADTAELFFSDVRLPAENLVGEVDRGFAHMMERLPQERLSVAIGSVHHAAQLLRETLAYVKERRAFGTPVGSFQANKHRIAELATTVDATIAFVDTCLLLHSRGRLTPVDAAKAKWWAAQVQNDVLDACVQLHGGYGYMREYRVAQAWMDARVSSIWAGSNEIMKELVGRDLGL